MRHLYDQSPLDFKSRCRRKLENLGDTAVNAKQYDGAISQYTIALSLNPTAPQDLLVKRSKAYAAKRWWGKALKDANDVLCSQLVQLHPY